MGNSTSSGRQNKTSSSTSVENGNHKVNGNKKYPGIYSSNNANLLVFGEYMEPRFVSKLSKGAKVCNAFDIKRVSLLSCCSVSTTARNRGRRMVHLSKFLQKHAPNLEWLLISGPLLLETNAEACQFLKAIPSASLKRLCISVGRPAETELGGSISEFVQRSPNLEHLSFSGFSWRSRPALQALSPALRHLTWLDMTHCAVSDAAFHVLVQALVDNNNSSSSDDDDSENGTCETNMKIESLCLMNNSLTNEALKDLAYLLYLCPSLTSLNMSHMPLFQHARKDDIDALVQAIAKTTTLQELNLSSTNMNLDAMKLILQAASQSTSVTTLHVDGNRVSPREALHLITEQLGEPTSLNISSLYVQQQHAPTAQQDPQPQVDGNEGQVDDDDDDHEFQRSCLEHEFLQKLYNHFHLTQLTIAASRANTGDGWFAPARAILDRNLLAQRLDAMTQGKHIPPLSVWPGYLHFQTPSLAYQLLQWHMSSIAVGKQDMNHEKDQIDTASKPS